MSLRIETINGLHLVCGGMLPEHAVRNTQTWAAADGSDHVVKVVSAGRWVDYTWLNGNYIHTKTNFDFQCHYCLVVDTPEVPEGLE